MSWCQVKETEEGSKVTIQTAFMIALVLTEMPTLPIPAGDSRFGSFNLSPTRFLKSCRNSRFFSYIH